MGSVGDAYDNAMAESFFSTLEAELLSRRRFASQAEAKDGLLQLHRELVQSRQATFRPGIPFAHGLRSKPANSRSRRVAPKSTNRPPDRGNLTIMPNLRHSLWRRDSRKLASGKPGAVQNALSSIELGL
jgi:hypothetical protein